METMNPPLPSGGTSWTVCSKQSVGRAPGFSLVELAMAMGIVSFALVGILGILPAGLNTFQQAMATSVSSQILQRIVSEAQQTGFNTLIDPSEPRNEFQPRYFDEEGNETAASTAVYDVKLVVNSNPTLPGALAPNPNLARLTVDIVHNPGRKTIPRDDGTGGFLANPANGIRVLRYSAFVARAEVHTP